MAINYSNIPFEEHIKKGIKGFIIINKNQKIAIYQPIQGKPEKPKNIPEDKLDKILLSYLSTNKDVRITTFPLNDNEGIVRIGQLEHNDEEYRALYNAMKIANLNVDQNVISSIIGIKHPPIIVSKNLQPPEIPITGIFKTSNLEHNQDIRIEKKLKKSGHKSKIHNYMLGGGGGVALAAALLLVFVVIPGDMNQAFHCLEIGDFSCAEEKLLGPEFIDPNNLSIQIGKFKALIGQGKFDEAIAYMNERPGLAKYVASQQAKINDLEEYYNQLQDDPDNVRAITGIGDIYDSWRLHTAAMEKFDEAVKVDPNHTNAYVGKCNVLSHQYNLSQAKKCYENVLGSNPKHVNALVGLGNVLDLMNQPNKAIIQFEQAVQEDPNKINTYVGWAMSLVKLEKYSEAEEKITGISSLENSSLAKIIKANIHVAKGEYRQALNEYDGIISKNPFDITALLEKGNVLIEMGRHDEAVKVFELVLKYEPFNEIAKDGVKTARNTK